MLCSQIVTKTLAEKVFNEFPLGDCYFKLKYCEKVFEIQFFNRACANIVLAWFKEQGPERLFTNANLFQNLELILTLSPTQFENIEY